MNYYVELANRDVIQKFGPEFKNGSFFLRDDGKITRDTKIATATPWIHRGQAPNRNCGLYHTFYDRLGIVHSRCQECWKVVARPRTLLELHKTMNIQNAMDYPCKCGMERRETVCGLYGAYWYNDSLEKGRACYKDIRAQIDANLGPEVVVLLKRGCTEFEIGGKPSDQWEVSDDQKELEFYLNNVFDMDVKNTPQPQHLKDSVFRTWIHWAYSNGDMTYKEYTDGKPLFHAYVTYHEAKDENKNESGEPERQEKDNPTSSGFRNGGGEPVYDSLQGEQT